MCGRTACALAPDDIQRACRFRDKHGRLQKPAWKDAPNGKQFYPSHNIAPGSHTPILLSGKHYDCSGETTSRVIQPMHWGLIPSWHKGKMSEKSYETNNCRAESMLDKQTYKVPLQKGRRCVILAEGFFEWKRSKERKQPYYIYFPQSGNHGDPSNNVKVEPGIGSSTAGSEVKVKLENDGETDNDRLHVKQKVKVKEEPGFDDSDAATTADNSVKHSVICDGQSAVKQERTEDKEDVGWKLLTMAGVFDVWKPSDGSEPVYSYSVITVESSPAMAWIHHRMPAMLTTDEEIAEWLDCENVPLSKAVKLIRPVTCLQSHPVSTVVNNSRNKTPDCVKPVDLSKQKKPVNSLMSAWLAQGNKVKLETTTNSPEKEIKKKKPAGRPNLMMNWLSQGKKKDRDKHDEPPDKRQKFS